MLKTNNIAFDGSRVMSATNKIDQANQILQRIWASLEKRQFDQAQSFIQQLNQQHPQFAPGWHAASVLAMHQGLIERALQHIELALSLSEKTPWQLHKARLLIMLRRRTQAKALASQLNQQSHSESSVYAELALLLNKLGLHQQALDNYQYALQLEPDNPGLLFNLASLQRYMGYLQEAENSLDRLIAIQPDDGEAWLLRSGLRKQTEECNHITALQKAVQQPGQQPINQAQLYYALGKELEDLQHYPQCFSALQQGANIRRRHMQYTLSNDIATLQKITQVFDAGVFSQSLVGCDNNQPIFILGLPRTGSTLVERIIGHHSEVFSAGELNNFALEMMALVRRSCATPPADKLTLIELTRQLDFKQLGENYIQSTRPDTQRHQRFIDKLPLNSLYIGLIHLALPKAKIIHIQRHPLDSCFAIFKQLFTHGYPFSYDLQELAQYQIAHHKMMQHWQRLLPGVIHQVDYEKLVADLPGEARKLIDYCQLPWQAQCAHFEQNTAAATTASAAQVRQPLYSSSVGKWRHFEQQLASVKQQFEQAGILCD